jgi:hypothetical protein
MARIQTQLTPTQLTQKRQAKWRGTQYVSVSRPALVFQATVNQSTFADTFAQVTYHLPIGSYSAVKAGMTVQIGAHFIGRVRQDASANTLFLNETSAPIQNGDSIRVWDDYRAWGILGRMVNGVEVIDWDQPYHGLRPMIGHLASVAVGWVSASTDDKLQLSFAPNAHPAEQGAMIDNMSWRWELPSGVTLQAGTLTQPAITVRCEAGEHWLHVSVADDGGRRSTRHIKVFAHSASFPPETRTDAISVEMTLENGVNATIPAFVGLDDLPDGALITVWTEADYDGVMVAPRIDAHGRLSRVSSGAEGDFQYQTIPHDLTAQVIGAGGQMGQIEAPKIALRDSPAPNVWGEINRPTLWRAVWHVLDRYTTLTTLYEIAFDDLSDTYIHPSPFALGGGQLLNAVNQLLSAINGGVQFAPDGVIECVRDGRWLPQIARDSLSVTASWDEHDALSYDAEHGSADKVGFVQAFGASWNSATQTSTPFSAIAPGVAFGAGDTSVSLNEQVLKSNVSSHIAQAELTERTAHEYAYRNVDDGLTVNLPDGYSDLLPARNVWHVWTLDELPATGKRWLLTRLTYRHDNQTGERDVQATFARETFGAGGQSLILPSNDGIENIIPTFPPFDVYPAFPELPNVVFPSNDPIYIPPVTVSPLAPNVPPRDGNGVMTWGDGDVWLTDDFKKSDAPTWKRITPPIDGDEIVSAASFGKGTEAFVLSYNRLNEQSRVWRCVNVFGDRLWQSGDWVTGKLDTLRVASPPSTLYVTGVSSEPPIAVEWEEEFDLSQAVLPDAVSTVFSNNAVLVSAQHIVGEGVKFEWLTGTATGASYGYIGFHLDRPYGVYENEYNVVDVEIEYFDRNVPPSGTGILKVLEFSAAVGGSGKEIASGTGAITESYGGFSKDSINLLIGVRRASGTMHAGRFVTMKRIKLRGTGINPFQRTPSWVQVFDFEQGDGGFTISSDSQRPQTLDVSYISGDGWQFKHTGVGGALSFYRVIELEIDPELLRYEYLFSRVEMEYTYDVSVAGQMYISTNTGNTFLQTVTMPLGIGTSVNGRDYPNRANRNIITIQVGAGNNSWLLEDDFVIIKKLTIYGITPPNQSNPFDPPAQALLGHSDDDGQTLTTHALGAPPLLGMIGLDTVTIGKRAYVGAGGISQAEEDDAPALYASLPAGLGVAGGVIVAPRLKADGTTNALDDPDLIVGSPALSDNDQALWRVTDAGATLTDITPEIGGHYGVIVSPNSLAVSWNDSDKIALIAWVDDEKHLLTWDGATWVDRGALGDDADYIRMRKQDSGGQELYFVDGDCMYSANYGVTVKKRIAPDEGMKGISVYG